MRQTFSMIAVIGLCLTVFSGLVAAESTERVPALLILDVDPDGTVVDNTYEDIEVLFDVPLPFGGEGVRGELISDIIKSTPLFSPIDGLPDAAWKGKTCSGCHQWERANLCEQGGFYVKDAGHPSLNKQHPMGGSFKQNLRNWAKGGCP